MAGKPGAVKTPWQDWEMEALKAAWPKGGLLYPTDAANENTSGDP